MILAVFNHKQRLDHVFDLARQGNVDPEITSHWARYLCVLTSGFVEDALRSILSDYASRHADAAVRGYVSARVERLTNLNEEKIAQLLGQFSPAWSEAFSAARTQEQKDALDSVLANRHLIAHGRSVGITLARMGDYYTAVLGAIRIIDERCVNAT